MFILFFMAIFCFKYDIAQMVRAQTNIDLFMYQQKIETDRQLAKLAGMSQQQLSQRLAGKLSMDTLERLAVVFKCSVKELLR